MRKQYRLAIYSGGAQRGVALIVALIFLLALAAITLLSARTAVFGEKVSRNQLDAQVSRQAAEAALRDAEKDLLLVGGAGAPLPAGALCARGADRPVLAQVNSARFTGQCLRGQCEFSEEGRKAADYAAATDENPGEAWWPTDKGGRWNNNVDNKPSPGSVARCADFTGAVPLGTFTGAARLAGVARQPEYLIEPIRRGDGVFFRITARGFGYRLETETVMQSYFQVPPL